MRKPNFHPGDFVIHPSSLSQTAESRQCYVEGSWLAAWCPMWSVPHILEAGIPVLFSIMQKITRLWEHFYSLLHAEIQSSLKAQQAHSTSDRKSSWSFLELITSDTTTASPYICNCTHHITLEVFMYLIYVLYGNTWGQDLNFTHVCISSIKSANKCFLNYVSEKCLHLNGYLLFEVY